MNFLIPYNIVLCDYVLFWSKMGKPGFIRLNYHYGRVRNTYFYAEVPPEAVPGFIENILDSIVSCLNLRPPKKHWYSLKRESWPWKNQK